MDEFLIYHRGKVVGGIYDYGLPVKSAIIYIPTARYELPCDGEIEMLLA